MRWEIGGFVPLTARDVREARTVHGVRDGLPFADDADKGVYVLFPSGAIVLRSPNVAGGQVPVVSSAAEFATLVAENPLERDF